MSLAETAVFVFHLLAQANSQTPVSEYARQQESVSCHGQGVRIIRAACVSVGEAPRTRNQAQNVASISLRASHRPSRVRHQAPTCQMNGPGAFPSCLGSPFVPGAGPIQPLAFVSLIILFNPGSFLFFSFFLPNRFNLLTLAQLLFLD